MDHWNEPQTDRLKRVDPIPDTNYERPAAALAAASQMMGTTVEQTFAALRQESEELQRLQVCTRSILSRAEHECRPGAFVCSARAVSRRALTLLRQAEAVARASGVAGHVLDFILDGGM